MPKPKTSTGEKNLISQRLIELRRQHNMSQRLLAVSYTHLDVYKRQFIFRSNEPQPQ